MSEIVNRLRDLADSRHMDRGHDAVDEALREAANELEEFKSRYEKWVGIETMPNEAHILSGSLMDFYCVEADDDEGDTAFSLTTTWGERPEQAVMWCLIVSPRWPDTPPKPSSEPTP